MVVKNLRRELLDLNLFIEVATRILMRNSERNDCSMLPDPKGKQNHFRKFYFIKKK